MTAGVASPWRRLVALLLLLSVALGACGGAKAAERRKIEPLTADLLPPTINDLEVRKEEVGTTIRDQERTYLEAVGLYSFRKKDLLQATLQISKFAPTAKYRTDKFRQAIIGQIGTTVPRQAVMGGHTVWVTSGKKQSVVIWFTGPYVLVLSTREDFTQSRKLLRSLLEVKL
jgi:hypothetical protein